MHFVYACLLVTLPLLAQCATFDVTVGGPGVLKYEPEFINAGSGDTIRFIFKQKNHTVTQSSFQNACQRLSDGFDTGFIPVEDSMTSGFPIAEFTITDNSPIWVYCRQANHCKEGMVFAINPGDKFEAFKLAATTGSSPTTSSSSASTSTQPTSTSSTNTSTTTSESNNSTSSVSVVTVTETVTTTATLLPNSTSNTELPTPTSTTTATTITSVDHRVTVGESGSLTFNPNNIQVNIGDTVTFEFRSKNHTVTQSSFSKPCESISGSGQAGFDSGFLPVDPNSNSFPAYSIQINDTKPIWAFCRQSNHCSQGMVFAINAIENSPNNFDAFQTLARTQVQQTPTSTTSDESNGVSSLRVRIRGRDIIKTTLGLTCLVLGSTCAFLL